MYSTNSLNIVRKGGMSLTLKHGSDGSYRVTTDDCELSVPQFRYQIRHHMTGLVSVSICCASYCVCPLIVRTRLSYFCASRLRLVPLHEDDESDTRNLFHKSNTVQDVDCRTSSFRRKLRKG